MGRGKAGGECVSGRSSQGMRRTEKRLGMNAFFFQNECHPLLAQKEVRLLCEKHAIVFQAYSSLGAGKVGHFVG